MLCLPDFAIRIMSGYLNELVAFTSFCMFGDKLYNMRIINPFKSLKTLDVIIW